MFYVEVILTTTKNAILSFSCDCLGLVSYLLDIKLTSFGFFWFKCCTGCKKDD